MEAHFTIMSQEDGGLQKECLQGKKQQQTNTNYEVSYVFEHVKR